jgi:hypothetical protein
MPLVAGRYVPPQRVTVDPLYDIDPRVIASWERTSGPLGSNPGGIHTDAQGNKFYVKAYSGAR